jgi:hypothetical protein
MDIGMQSFRLRQRGRDHTATPGQRGDDNDDREDLPRRP